MVGYLIFELRRLARIRTLLAYGTLVPLMIYTVISLTSDDLTEQHRGIPVAALVMVIVAGIGAMIGVLTHAAGIAYERADGWLRQLRATPLPPSRVVAVRALVSLLTVLPPLLAVPAAAVVLHGLTLPPARWLLVLAVMWLGAVPFALLGLALGFTLSRDLVGPAISVAWLVLAFLGGLMLPTEMFPAWLRPVSQSLPSYRYAETGWLAVAGHPPSLAAGAILAGWTALFGLLAVGAYRRWAALR
jgi:ABC-2 type transport system permease protein